MSEASDPICGLLGWGQGRKLMPCPEHPNQVVHSFQESDGAVPLEQRNAELVRHRDGLAEAAVAWPLDAKPPYFVVQKPESWETKGLYVMDCHGVSICEIHLAWIVDILYGGPILRYPHFWNHQVGYARLAIYWIYWITRNYWTISHGMVASYVTSSATMTITFLDVSRGQIQPTLVRATGRFMQETCQQISWSFDLFVWKKQVLAGQWPRKTPTCCCILSLSWLVCIIQLRTCKWSTSRRGRTAVEVFARKAKHVKTTWWDVKKGVIAAFGSSSHKTVIMQLRNTFSYKTGGYFQQLHLESTLVLSLMMLGASGCIIRITFLDVAAGLWPCSCWHFRFTDAKLARFWLAVVVLLSACTMESWESKRIKSHVTVVKRSWWGNHFAVFFVIAIGCYRTRSNGLAAAILIAASAKPMKTEVSIGQCSCFASSAVALSEGCSWSCILLSSSQALAHSVDSWSGLTWLNHAESNPWVFVALSKHFLPQSKALQNVAGKSCPALSAQPWQRSRQGTTECWQLLVSLALDKVVICLLRSSCSLGMDPVHTPFWIVWTAGHGAVCQVIAANAQVTPSETPLEAALANLEEACIAGPPKRPGRLKMMKEF